MCTQPLDSRENAIERVTSDADFSKLKGNGTGMSDDARTDFNQPGLQAGQRPIGYLVGQRGPLQEYTEILGQCMELQADLVLRHSLT